MAMIRAASGRRAQRVLAAGVCLAALCLAGCFTPNTRTAEFGHVTAHARLKDGEANYFAIDFHQPMDPLSQQLWLRLPDGRIIDRTWFSHQLLQQAGFVSALDQEYQPGNVYSIELTRYGASFCFDLGTLQLIRLFQKPNDAVAFSIDQGKQFHTLPLSQQELEKVFGKPDKVSDVFRF